MLLDFDPSDPAPSHLVPIVPPDADPASGVMRKLTINEEWLKYIIGACTVLTRDDIWDVATDDERILANKRGIDVLTQLSLPLIEQPFFDNDDNVDGEPLADYPWYEQLADWVITAFLAITTTIGAAIVYKTSIPKIRLAFRTGDLGVIVRVLINEIEAWTADTYAPAQGELAAYINVADFAAALELGDPPWTIKVVNDGPAPSLRPRRLLEDDPRLEVILGDIRVTETIQMRQNGCNVELSTNGGQDWVTIYDPTDCIAPLVDQSVQDAIDDGRLQWPGTPQEPQAPPAAGECVTYHVLLAGNDQWHCPSPVQAGDIITVSNARGGWSDGTLTWFCPDGSVYFLGICDDTAKRHEEFDPIPTVAYHMQVIGLFDETYFDPLTAPYTVPTGTDPTDFVIRANDDDLADNSGEISLDVEVCSGGWTHIFDFTVNNGGFSAFVESGHVFAQYSAGVGWIHGVNAPYNTYTRFQRLAFTPTYVLNAEVYTLTNPATNRATLKCNNVSGAAYNVVQNTYDVVDGLYRRIYTLNREVSGIYISGDINTDGVVHKKLIVRGLGTDPFA